VIEPASRLHLDVLANSVKTESLLLLKVEAKGSVSRRRIDAVRPVTLVESAHLEDESNRNQYVIQPRYQEIWAYRPLRTGRKAPLTIAVPTDLMPKYPVTTSPDDRVTRRSYRKGSSGLQRRALGTEMRSAVPTVADALPTVVPPVDTTAVTV